MPDAQNSNPTNTVAVPAPDADATAAGTNRATNSEFSLGAPAAPGELGVFGPYRVLKELGRGGMGAVYLALDTRLDRELALKVMLPAFAADPASKERFLREAKAVAKVAHDHVVTIFEADERDGVPYIAMQFLQGAPLDEYLKKKGSPPVAHCVRIVREAALGLAAAHARGLVHRDIKPANLWLEAPNGRVKVLDFGLAKPIGTESELTKTGAVVGTPAYMSPEQARGQKVDHRTDIFSLGAVLYRLLTGRNPFLGDHIMAVLTALAVEEPTPVRELNPNVPAALADFVNQLLAKKPEARPQSAAEVAERLRTVLSQPVADASASVPVLVQPLPVPVQVTAAESAFANLTEEEEDDRTEREAEPVPEPAPKRSKRLLLAGGALALVAVVGVAIALGTGGKKPDDSAKNNPEPPPAPQPQPKKDADKDKPPVVPKVECRAGQVWTAGATATEVLALKGHTAGVTEAWLSPDGTRILTSSFDKTAKIWDAKTGWELLTLQGHTEQLLRCAFSPDGTRVVTGSDDKTAKIWNAQTGAELLTLKGHTLPILGLAFSPDGTRVVTGSADNTAKVWEVHSGKPEGIATTGAELLTFRGHTRWVHAASFSPDGSRVVTGSDDKTAKVWDAKTGAVVRTLQGHTTCVFGAAFGADGTRIVTGCGDGTAKVWDATTGAELFTLKGHTGWVRTASFSADGTRIVTASGYAGKPGEVKVWDAKTGAELLTITGFADRALSASFSPDGTRIITACDDKTAKVWEARPSALSSVAFTPEGETEWSKFWVAHGAQGWKLQDGRLWQGGTNRGWIGTKAEYTDFEIELEYKFGERGNSGVFLRAWAEGDISGSQFVEVQLIDDDGYKVSGLTGTGAIFKRVPPNPLPVTKLDEWNRATVRVVGKRVTVTINGTKCTDSDIEFPRAKGAIGLQQLGAPVEFRNVRVRDLSAVPGPEGKIGAIEPPQKGTEAERTAALRALALGGRVTVREGDGGREINNVADLPDAPVVIGINVVGVAGVRDADLDTFAGARGLWHLQLANTAITDAGLARLKPLTALRSLNLNLTAVDGSGLAHLAGATEMSSVSLGKTRVTDANLVHLKPFTKLRQFNAQETQLTGAGFAHLKGAPRLTFMTISDTAVTDAALEHLAGLKGLRSVHLKRSQVTGTGVLALAKARPGCSIDWDGPPIRSTLQVGTDQTAAKWALSVGGNVAINTEFGQRVVKDAAKLPADFFQIAALDLSNLGAKVTDKDLAKVRGLTTLSNLYLHGAPDVTDTGLAALAHSPALEVLILSGTKVTGTGLVHTKDLLQLYLAGAPVSEDGLKRVAELTKLTHLNLNVTKVTDAQLAHLKGLIELAHLDLSDTALTDTGLEHLTGLTKLAFLRLKGTKVTDAAVKKLASALPQCRIEWDGGKIEPNK